MRGQAGKFSYVLAFAPVAFAVQGELVVSSGHNRAVGPSVLVSGVKAYALSHYDESGWDFIAESWDDGELLQAIGDSVSVGQAIQRVARAAKLIGESRS